MRRTTAHPSGNGDLFTVTVRWEYTTIPKHAQRRFVCVSDREEYIELTQERDSTSAWFLHPANGVDASRPETFELQRFTVNGDERPIRRSARKTGQTYTGSLAPEHLAAGKPVTIAYTYRTVMAQNGHLLFFDIEQPTRDLKVEFDYTGCGIEKISTLDLVPSVRPTRIEQSRAGASRSTVRVDFDGWVFPRSGVAFVWTLQSEISIQPRDH
jgi:hypothetical protein